MKHSIKVMTQVERLIAKQKLATDEAERQASNCRKAMKAEQEALKAGLLNEALRQASNAKKALAAQQAAIQEATLLARHVREAQEVREAAHETRKANEARKAREAHEARERLREALEEQDAKRQARELLRKALEAQEAKHQAREARKAQEALRQAREARKAQEALEARERLRKAQEARKALEAREALHAEFNEPDRLLIEKLKELGVFHVGDERAKKGRQHAVGGGGGQHHHHGGGGHGGGGHGGGGQHHHHAVGGQDPSLPPHVRGMKNAVVFLWSRRKYAVFLVKQRNGQWTLPGGKKDHRDKNTRAAGKRETFEEGVRGKNGRRVEVTGVPSTWGRPAHTTFYCGEAPEGVHFEQHWRNTETCDGQWFSWQELNQLAARSQLRFPESTLFYAQRLLKH